MTRRLLAFLLLVAGPGSLAAQNLINKGAHLVVQAGAALYVHGALLNPASGTLSSARVRGLLPEMPNSRAYGFL